VLIAASTIFAVFVLALAIGIYYLGSNKTIQNPSPSPAPSPSPTIYKRTFPVVDVHLYEDNGYSNVGVGSNKIAPGSSFSLNFELENRLNNQTDVTCTFDLNGMDPISPLSTLSFINATFSTPNPVTLRPLENKTITLTVSIADNIPMGGYRLVANFVSLDDSMDGRTFSLGYPVAFDVVP